MPIQSDDSWSAGLPGLLVSQLQPHVIGGGPDSDPAGAEGMGWAYESTVS